MNKFFKIVLAFALALIPFSGKAQTEAQRWNTAVIPQSPVNPFAQVIPNAQVYVCVWNSQKQCNTPFTIYADPALQNIITQPLQANANGVYSYYVQSGSHVVEKICGPYQQCNYYEVYVGNNTTVAGLALQHNGVALPVQNLLNFLDTPASLSGGSLDSGYQAVKFKNDSAGGLAAETVAFNPSSGLIMQVSTPSASAQQYILYPTTSSGTGYAQNTVACGGSNPGDSCSGSGTLANGGYIAHPYCTSGCTSNPSITYTFSVPSFIPSTGLTVYGGMVGYTSTTTLVGNGPTFALTCGIGGSQTNVMTQYAYDPLLPFGTYTALLSGITTSSQVNTVTCTGSIASTDPVQAGLFANLASVFLVINYTGTTPPNTGAINVLLPLIYNPGPNTLGLSIPFDVGTDTGSADSYVVSIPWINQRASTSIKFVPTHNNLTTTPTLNFNGIGAATIVGPQGGALQAGDLNTTATAIVVLDASGNWRLQDPQVSGSSANTISVNGVVVSSPNLNDTTPAAGTNGKNVAWQHSGSSVSAEIVGDGTATHYLDGTGHYTTPAGSGSVTWPASTDVVISNGTNSPNGVAPVNGDCLVGVSGAWASGSCSGGGSGVQYNPSNTQVFIVGASDNGDDQGNTLGPTINVSSWTGNGTLCSVTNSGTNSLVAGDWVYVNNMGSYPALNLGIGTDMFQVLSSGLSTTTFTFNCPVTGSGSGGTVEVANNFLPIMISNEPYFKGHSAVSFQFSTAQNLATNFNSVVGTATTSPAFYLDMSMIKNDIGASCRSAAQIEGDLQTIWATAHTNGWTVIQVFPNPIQWNTSNLGCTTAFQTWFTIYKWLVGQGKNIFNQAPYCTTTCGKYWDAAIDEASLMRDAANTTLFNNGNKGVFSVGGVKRVADYVNQVMVNQGSSVIGSFPYYVVPAPFTSGSLYGNTFGNVFAPTNDSHQAFNFENAALTTDYLNIDTTSNIVQLPYLTPASTSCLTIASGNGQLGTTSCSGSLSGMTAGQVPIAATATTVTSSKAIQGTDTNLLSSGTVSGTGAALCTDANGGATTSGCPAGGAFAGGLGASYQDVTEIAAPANPSAGNDRLYTNSTTHQLSCLTSSGGNCMPTSSGIANTTTTVGTTAVSANTCTTATTVTMTGVTTSSVFDFTPSTDITGTTGWGSTGGLVIVAWPTANTLNYKVCNQTASSITPSGSVTFNVGAR